MKVRVDGSKGAGKKTRTNPNLYKIKSLAKKDQGVMIITNNILKSHIFP